MPPHNFLIRMSVSNYTILRFFLYKTYSKSYSKYFILLINRYRMHTLQVLLAKSKSATFGPNFEISCIQKKLQIQLNTFVLLINIYRMHNLRYICKKSLFGKSKSGTSGPNFEIFFIQKIFRIFI